MDSIEERKGIVWKCSPWAEEDGGGRNPETAAGAVVLHGTVELRRLDGDADDGNRCGTSMGCSLWCWLAPVVTKRSESRSTASSYGLAAAVLALVYDGEWKGVRRRRPSSFKGLEGRNRGGADGVERRALGGGMKGLQWRHEWGRDWRPLLRE